MALWKQSSLKNDGKKSIRCPNCGTFMTTSFLGEKKEKTLKCRDCGSWVLISPPKIGEAFGKKGVYFGPSDCVFSAWPE
jgi:DNA-directed RNA polymerase subunit RPC12/RpoP